MMNNYDSTEDFKKALEKFDNWPFNTDVMCMNNDGIFVGRKSLSSLPTWITIVCTKQEFEEAKTKMKEEKRYWNGKEELEVGMWVLYQGVETEILLAADIASDYVIKGGDDEYHFVSQEYLKPIDARTDKEKFIDEIINDLPAYVRADELDIRMAIEKAYDKLKGDEK